MPRKAEILAEEASVSSPLRRSSRINVAVNSPAPSTLTSKKHLQFDTEVPESKAPKTRRASVTQENSENEDKKENRNRGRRASTSKEETEQKPEPAKPRSRRSSATAEPTVKEEEKRNTVTRRRRSSAAEEPPEPEVVRPVRGRRSSTADTHEEEDIAKKPVRGRRGSVQKEEPQEEPVRKSLRNRKDSITEKKEEPLKIDTKEKRATRGRRSSTDRLEDEPEIKTTRLTPSKSRRRLSATENAPSLEPIEELESEIKSRKSDSPIKSDLRVILDPSPIKEKTPQSQTVDTNSRKSDSPTNRDLTVVLSLTPVKKDKFKEAKTNLNLSVIDESSFTEPSPKESPELAQEDNENTLQQPELKLEMKNARDNISEQNAAESTVDEVQASKSDNLNISMGSDGSFRFHLNVSLPSTTSQNLSQDEDNEEDDVLNSSNTSNNSDKENMETNSPEDLNETEHILENKENLINTESHDNRNKLKVETSVVVARISNVFRPKMIENSFSEPMDVDQSPSVLGTTQNKISLELDESAKSTPITKKHIRSIKIEESKQKAKPFTEIVCKRDIEVAESDSEDESFKLSLSISHVGQPEASTNTPQDEDENSTEDSECADEDSIEVCGESPSQQSSINEDPVSKNTEDSQAPKQTTDLEESNDSIADSITDTAEINTKLLEETAEYEEDEPKIQENSLFKQKTEEERVAECVDKPKNPQMQMSDEIKLEPEDAEILENLAGKQDAEIVDEPDSQFEEVASIKSEFEENISSGESSPQSQELHIQDETKVEEDENPSNQLDGDFAERDIEIAEGDVIEKQGQEIVQEQFQEIESAKLTLEENRSFSKSKSPQHQSIQIQEQDQLEVEKEDNLAEIKRKPKLKSENPLYYLDDDNTKISKSTENLDTKINPATKAPPKLRDVEMARSSPTKELDVDLEQKPQKSENLEPSSEKQFMETEELIDTNESLDEESNQTNESSLLRSSEEEIEVTSPSPKRSVSPREATPEPENQLPITEFPHPDLDSHFKTTEEYEEESVENLDVELDQVQQRTLLRASKSPQSLDDNAKDGSTELQSNEETEVTSTSKIKSDSSTSSNDDEPKFDQKSDSPLSQECPEEEQQLPESEQLKESCESDDYEFDISSDDEDVEKTGEFNLEREPVKGESHLHLLEIATNKEAKSKMLSSPLKRETTNTEDTESKENNISLKQSESTVLTIENAVNKEKDFEEYADNTDENDKIDSSGDEIDERRSNNTSHVVEEATDNSGNNEAVYVAESHASKDISVDKLETRLNKESLQQKETQDELEEMANCNEDMADIDDVYINENKESNGNQQLIKNITDYSNQTGSVDSTMEDPATDYKQMETNFKDVPQDYKEQRARIKKLKMVKKSLMKATEESSELITHKEKPMTSDTEEIFEKKCAEEACPNYSKKSSYIDVLKAERKPKKKLKKHKIKEDNATFVSIIYENKENTSCDLTVVSTYAIDDSKTKEELQKLEDESDGIAERSNNLASIANIETEPDRIESDSETIERKPKTGKKKSKKKKTTLKETAKGEHIAELPNSGVSVIEQSLAKEPIENVIGPIKKTKKAKKKVEGNKQTEVMPTTEYTKKKSKKYLMSDSCKEQNVTDVSESIEDAEIKENLKTVAKLIETEKNKETESDENGDFRNEIPKHPSRSKGDKEILKHTKVPRRENHEEAELTKPRSPKRKSEKLYDTKEDQAEDVEEVASSKKKFKKNQKKTRVAEQKGELEPAKKQSRELTQTYEEKNNTKISDAERKCRKRKADESTHLASYKSIANVEKKRKKIEKKTESDSDEIDVSPQKQSVEQAGIEEFANSKLDEYLSKKIAAVESEEERSYTDTSEGQDEQGREENEFICGMAEEGEEDTPSEGSNDIIDEGESINTTESETEPDDYDEDDSFICDEEAEELLSGNEYDLGDEKKEKRSRIIPLDNYDDDIIKVERKKKPIKKKKSRIIIVTDSSDAEDENEKLESHDNEHSEENVKLAPPSSEQSTFSKDISYSEEQTSDLEESPVQTAIKPVKSDVPTNTLDTSAEGEETNHQNRRRSSITIHENINVSEIKDAALSQRISNLVDTFCTSIQKGEISMNLSLQYATKEASEASSQDESDDVFIEDSKKVTRTTPPKMSAQELSSGSSIHYKSEGSDESESEGNAGCVKTPSSDKSKGAKSFKFVTTANSSAGSSSNVNYEENDTEDDMTSKKAERLSISLDNEDLDGSKKKSSKKRRLSKSLEDLPKIVNKKKKTADKAFDKPKKNLTMKKKIKNPRRADKFKKQSSSERNLHTHTLSIMNQLITDVKNRPIRTIKPSRDTIDMNGSWITEIANVRPSTSLVSRREMTEYKASKIHPKDFRTQMLYNSSRVKRVDTKTLLRKKGAYF